MDKANILYFIIELIAFLLPAGGLLWKAAKQSARIDEHEKRLNHLEKIDDTIDKINIAIAELQKDIQYIKEKL